MFGDALWPYSTHEWMQMHPWSTYKQAIGGPESASECKTLTGVERGFVSGGGIRCSGRGALRAKAPRTSDYILFTIIFIIIYNTSFLKIKLTPSSSASIWLVAFYGPPNTKGPGLSGWSQSCINSASHWISFTPATSQWSHLKVTQDALGCFFQLQIVSLFHKYTFAQQSETWSLYVCIVRWLFFSPHVKAWIFFLLGPISCKNSVSVTDFQAETLCASNLSVNFLETFAPLLAPVFRMRALKNAVLEIFPLWCHTGP